MEGALPSEVKFWSLIESNKMGTNTERERRKRNEILIHLRNRFINRSNLKSKNTDQIWRRFVQIRREETDRSVSSRGSWYNPRMNNQSYDHIHLKAEKLQRCDESNLGFSKSEKRRIFDRVRLWGDERRSVFLSYFLERERERMLACSSCLASLLKPHASKLRLIT